MFPKCLVKKNNSHLDCAVKARLREGNPLLFRRYEERERISFVGYSKQFGLIEFNLEISIFIEEMKLYTTLPFFLINKGNTSNPAPNIKSNNR